VLNLKIAGKVREVEIRDDGEVAYHSEPMDPYLVGKPMLQTSFKIDGENAGVSWTSVWLLEMTSAPDAFREEEDAAFLEGLLESMGASPEEMVEAEARFRSYS
jgi:hypothetical protein